MSSSTDGSTHHKSSKLGRKGDPRMHTAVSARLEDPNLTLYEALKIGGFDYPTNDDASLIDSEKVTLGQRKNQLSRRLRLARKQHTGGASPVNIDGTNKNNFDVAGAERQNLTKKAPHSSLGARALQMKRDYDLTLGESDFASADSANNIIGMMEEQAKRPRIAKHHPDYAPLIVPPASFRGAHNFDPSLVGGSIAPAPSMNMGSPGFGSGNLTGPLGMSISGLSSGPYFNPQFSHAFSALQQPRASAVAVSSLTSSAQAVGLTLEQLALALSSNTTNLAKLIAETKSGESMAKQQDLALNLFETESKSLYTKCMIMSGIDMSLAQPGTPTYMAFAMKAWQAEGKRLQDMMSSAQRESAGIDASDLSVGETTGTFKMGTEDVEVGENNADNDVASQSTDGNEQVHDHVQQDSAAGNLDDHDSSTCNAQHVHRLGQCGHKAIIHQPKDGAAHIDFIVNDQVECYMGLDSVPFGRSVDSAWPSKYKCRDVPGPSNKTCSKSVLGSINANENSGSSEPKILKLSEINLQDPEWNYDGGDSIDGGVMGLFKLGGDGSG